MNNKFIFGSTYLPIKLDPIIKWSGSKRNQAKEILKYFPKNIDTYYEPFLGGGSILGALLLSDIKVNKYCCSDLNESLIGVFNLTKENPKELSEHYSKLWNEMKSIEDIEGKKKYYISVRERYNRNKDPKDFFFIMRTTFNGMPRYNSNGDFNNPLHINRDGINPVRMNNIINDWHILFVEKDVNFSVKNFSENTPTKDDFMYCDPPYEGSNTMYFGSFNTKSFIEYIRNLKCHYVISYDGFRNDEGESKISLPEELYNEHIYLKSGNSSFSRLKGKSNVNVMESLYIK